MKGDNLAAERDHGGQQCINNGLGEGELGTSKDFMIFIKNPVVKYRLYDISENEIDYFAGRTVCPKQAGYKDIRIEHCFHGLSIFPAFLYFGRDLV